MKKMGIQLIGHFLHMCLGNVVDLFQKECVDCLQLAYIVGCFIIKLTAEIFQWFDADAHVHHGCNYFFIRLATVELQAFNANSIRL